MRGVGPGVVRGATLLAVLSLAVAAEAAAPWRVAQRGIPTLNDIAANGTRFVAVGFFGEIYTSTDGLAWNQQPTTDAKDLNSVVFGGGQFVAVGISSDSEAAAVLTSPDGITWTERNSSPAMPVQRDRPLNGVTFGNALYVAVGNYDSATNQAKIVTSPDGITWTARSSNVTQDLRGVAFGGGQFVAVGTNRTVLTSPDGVTWTNQTAGVTNDIGHLNAVAFSGSWVAVGQDGRIITSPTGGTWTRRTAPANAWDITLYHIYDVTAAGGLFVAVGFDGTVITSSDSVTWTSRSITDPTNLNRGIPISLIGVARNGAGNFATVGRTGGIWTSPDGITTWTNRTSDPSRLFWAVANDGTRYCTVGVGWEGAISSSPDGLNWTRRKGIDFPFGFFALAYGNGKFVAAGEIGMIMSSPDCVTWTERNEGRDHTPASGITGFSYGAAFGNNTFVVVGDETVSPGLLRAQIGSSPDGITWTPRDPAFLPDGAYLTGVAHGSGGSIPGGGRFVAVGQNYNAPFTDYIISSDDNGASWTQRALPAGWNNADNTYAITFAAGKFVAVGSQVLTSPDGITWTKQAATLQTGKYGITYGDGLFVAVGLRGDVAVSADGIGWSSANQVTARDQYSVAYSTTLRRFVAVGESIITVAGGPSPGDATGDSLGDLLTRRSDGTVRVLASTGTSLGGAATTGQNSTQINIPTVGAANPYPSTISIGSFTGTVGKVTVSLFDLQHNAAADLDVLVVGPAGQKVLLMSDVSGNYVGNLRDFTFDDSGPVMGASPASGTYQPTNLSDGVGTDIFEAPAPASPYSGALSAFNGTNPVGTWSLFVRDDNAGGTGEVLAGWSLTVQASVTTWTSGFVPYRYDVYYADVDGDGKSDLVSRSKDTGDIDVYKSTGGSFTFALGSAPGGHWSYGWGTSYDLFFSDVTGDGRDDLIGRLNSNGDIYVFPSAGNGFTASPSLWSYGWSSGYNLFFGDVTGDGKADLVARYFGPAAGLTGDIYVGISTGSAFVFSGLWTYGYSSGYDVYLADVDADGKADLIARYFGTGGAPTGAVYVQVSTGSLFSWNNNFNAWSTGWGSTYNLVIRDVNGDGRADMIGRHSGNGDVYVALSTGSAFAFNGTWATGVTAADELR